MINYPPGHPLTKKTTHRKSSIPAGLGNRGMGLEKLINAANDYYLENDIALFTKRPTPINVVKLDYSRGAKITDAYFEKQSTTDYNGVYKGHYFDFEAKSTNQKTSFPLSNIHKHQIIHLENVIRHGGFAFFIIEFSFFNEIYVMRAEDIITAYQEGVRKSIPYETFKEKAVHVPLGLNPILDYLKAVKTLISL